MLGSTLFSREAYPNVEPAIWTIASRLLFSIAPMKNEEILNAKERNIKHKMKKYNSNVEPAIYRIASRLHFSIAPRGLIYLH